MSQGKGSWSGGTALKPTIVTLGGGNAEYLYELEDEIRTGEKNAVAEARELAGGGGMNFACRLIAAGFETYPILAVGNDRSGIKIQQELIAAVEKARLSKTVQDFICSPDFFVPGLTTAFATLIVLAAKRTILNYRARGNPSVFQRHMRKRLRQVVELTGGNPTVIHMSHLPNLDSPGSSHTPIGNEVIKDVLRAYGGKCVISFNPGTSQLQHGIRYWETEIKKTSILQLNMSEAKQIFAKDGLSTSLVDMINWFQEREISAVITLDRFGAVGSHKAGRDGILFAWPIELAESEVVDPTGAGDAFAAGVVSQIVAHPNFGFQDFLAAINTGRYWSAYACTTLGGAGSCPNLATIQKFRAGIERRGNDPIEVIHERHAVRDLRLINKAFE
jgi:sugar/nucleoside kinase (ribokinase family)